jgi:transposase-like protein
MRKRKQHTKEFKEGAVRLVTEQGRSKSDVADNIGLTVSPLYERTSISSDRNA